MFSYKELDFIFIFLSTLGNLKQILIVVVKWVVVFPQKNPPFVNALPVVQQLVVKHILDVVHRPSVQLVLDDMPVALVSETETGNPGEHLPSLQVETLLPGKKLLVQPKVLDPVESFPLRDVPRFRIALTHVPPIVIVVDRTFQVQLGVDVLDEHTSRGN